jgi:hypothetical protein
VKARSEAVVKSPDKYCSLNTSILCSIPGVSAPKYGGKAVDQQDATYTSPSCFITHRKIQSAKIKDTWSKMCSWILHNIHLGINLRASGNPSFCRMSSSPHGSINRSMKPANALSNKSMTSRYIHLGITLRASGNPSFCRMRSIPHGSINRSMKPANLLLLQLALQPSVDFGLLYDFVPQSSVFTLFPPVSHFHLP